ncbi:nuclease-related domain-containing protein [Paucibacter sp. XJ19-41]|uniref:nuclease-related domain-containing protein n=1 Tax=Paucibacter sp. XJ19-41 TaxID=2927824 RepID=UPI00234AE00D|nr:nuclease-related domain-containing protein [Paucibacter sp. XJ19-41]MDC6166990.1 nuclease-related domain-containing protein [Paucibacter sp. XJ19-41]
MLIKHADDKTKRLVLLEELQRSSLLDKRQRDWLKDEQHRTVQGIHGEREAAHYIDNWLKDGVNHAVLHDLRISVDGETAQIDHLVINRALRIYLFETKCFNGHLQINAQGEFTVRYGSGKAFGIASPLEQSRRHERVLARLLERLGITGRAGMKPSFQHVVLLHPKAIISRPDSKAFDTRDIVKADQIASWHERYVEERVGVGATLGMLANFHSTDTLKGWAEKLARQHRPQDQLALPEFMAPKAASAPPAAALAAREASSADYPAATDHPLKRKLVCVSCMGKISFAEGKFCWNNEGRFGGLQYCREHQTGFG